MTLVGRDIELEAISRAIDQARATTNYQPPIDGATNDGRPGEHDNVTRVERIYLTADATLTGPNEADELTIFNSDGSSKLYGRGGDDKLSAFNLADIVDGGAGNDTIEGGFGDDTITGGPGRDMINADVSGTSCHWIQCQMPYGNDTVDARDGEADSVTCGIGADVVYADPQDTVSRLLSPRQRSTRALRCRERAHWLVSHCDRHDGAPRRWRAPATPARARVDADTRIAGGGMPGAMAPHTPREPRNPVCGLPRPGDGGRASA